MRKHLAGLASLALVGTFAFAMPGHAANSGQSSRTYGTNSADCTKPGDGTVTASPDVLWPPNHKMKTITVSYFEGTNNGDGTATGDGDGDKISLADFTVGQVDAGAKGPNDDGEGQGSGQPGVAAGKQGADYTTPANGQGTGEQKWAGSKPVADTVVWSTTVQIRSERAGSSGPNGGRVYAINVTCHSSDATEDPGNDNASTATVFVCVPHDQSQDTRNAECPAVVPNYPTS